MNGLIIGGNISAVCLKYYNWAVVNILFGNLAADCTIAMQQAKNVGGSGIKTLGLAKMFKQTTNNSDPEQADMFQEVTVTADVYTVSNSSEDNAFFKIEVNPADLDVDNDFDCIRPLVTAGAGATLVAVWIDLFAARYRGKENQPKVFPSALAHG